jgi:hypothetical protein
LQRPRKITKSAMATTGCTLRRRSWREHLMQKWMSWLKSTTIKRFHG